ncbi:MAG: (2Fe-2S)-binding protein [Candidatus Eisenbacteria bacterium]|nr:(2Fe-2S)-binding protein [Candidatus Eisenbacteria bacterium]
MTLTFTLNGARRRVSVPPLKRLLDVLREECGLTGTKEGCGEGECGACTVLLDGLPVNSCLVPAAHAAGAKVTTVEGLSRNGRLSNLQRSFVNLGAAQCGMCTPGMVVTSAALLATLRGRVPSQDEVRVALAGTLCRCTGYQKIVDAVRAAARPARPAKSSASGKRKRAAATRARARAAAGRPPKPAARGTAAPRTGRRGAATKRRRAAR